MAIFSGFFFFFGRKKKFKQIAVFIITYSDFTAMKPSPNQLRWDPPVIDKDSKIDFIQGTPTKATWFFLHLLLIYRIGYLCWNWQCHNQSWMCVY